MKKEMERRCRDCRHFRRGFDSRIDEKDMRDMDAGQCCAHAPRPRAVSDCDRLETQNLPWAQFPLVGEEMVCGEFQPREEDEE